MAADIRTYFIDANVPIYAVGRDSEYKAVCLQVLEAVAKQEIIAASDAEVIQELVHHYHRTGQLVAGAVGIRRFRRLVSDIHAVTADDAMAALDLLSQSPGLDARDAVHWAVMRRVGISHVITADRHFAGLPGLTSHDPRDVPL